MKTRYTKSQIELFENETHGAFASSIPYKWSGVGTLTITTFRKDGHRLYASTLNEVGKKGRVYGRSYETYYAPHFEKGRGLVK